MHRELAPVDLVEPVPIGAHRYSVTWTRQLSSRAWWAGVGAGVWATRISQRLAREGRFEERRIDAYLEILRLVEHRTLWWGRRLMRLEVSGDPQYTYGHSTLPDLPRAPEVDEVATFDALLAAFGSEELIESCDGWVASTERLEELHEIAAWNYHENYHGPDTETDPTDLTNIRLEVGKLRNERSNVAHAVRREIEVVRKRARRG